MKIQTLGLQQPEQRSTSVLAAPQILENPAVPLSTPAAWAFWSGYGESSAGELVNDVTSMHSAVVNACVSLLSNSIASMSPILYQRQGAGRVEAFSNPLHSLLSLEPNPEHTSFTLWHSFMSSILLTGNGFIEIQRSPQGEVVSLWWLDPRQVTIIREQNGTLAYRTSEAMAPGSSRVIKATDMLHVPWHLRHDGVTGISALTLARQSVGTSLAMSRYEGQFYGNNATPSGILTVPEGKKTKPEDKVLMRQDWQEMNGGQHRRGVAVLDNGMTFTPLSISQADAEWVASKNMSREELCGLFSLHPSQIGSEARVAGETYSSQQLSYLTDCLRPWLNRVSQELTRKLIPKFSGLSIEHNISDRLRVDFASQMQGYAVGRQWGFYTANQVRAKLGENPGGPECDVYLRPVNMVDASDPTPTPTNTGATNV